MPIRGAERAWCWAQETPDPPEALTCMPSLQLSDIPKRAATIPTEISEVRAMQSRCKAAVEQHRGMALFYSSWKGTMECAQPMCRAHVLLFFLS